MVKKIRKKIVAFLLTLVICIGLLPMSVFAEELTMLAFEVDSLTTTVGKTVQVKISLKNNPGVASVKILVNFDKSLVLTDVKYNPNMGGQSMNPSTLDSPVTLIWVNPFGEFEEDATFATLTFTVPSNVDDTYVANINVTFDENDIYNLNEDNIPCKVNNGSITIYAGVPGDINGDGVLNNKDLTRLFQYLAAWDVSVNQIALDVNGDGNVNNKDLTRLFQYLAGWDVDIYFGNTTQHKHSIDFVPSKSATCTNEGNLSYYYCNGCGKCFSDSYGKNEIVKENVIIAKIDHTVVIDNAVPATSTTTGLTEGSHCSECLAILVPQDVVPIPASDQYAITYHIANGDSYLSTIDITNSNATQYDSSKGYSLKNIEAPGYIFLGWYDLPAGANAEIVKKIPAGESGEIELYAHWEKISYTIQFESDLVQVDDVTYTTDKGVTLPIPKLDGYNFIGWSNDQGEILKVVPKGTIGNKVYVANWLSERNKAWTKQTLDEPIIMEDEDTGTILFTYEVGKIENVPLYVLNDFGYINSEGVSRTVTITYSETISESCMDQYTNTVSNSTTNSAQWALSSGWTDSISINENFLKENQLTEEQAREICTSDGTNWLVSNGTSGSSTVTSFDSSQDYNLTTVTHNSETSDSDSKTKKFNGELDLSGKLSGEISGGADIEGIANIGGKGGFELGAELDISAELSKTKAETKKEGEGTNTQTGNIVHTGTDTVNTASWNSTKSYSGSSSVSNSEKISAAISEKIATEYGYGKSYVKNGEESTSQGLSSSNSSSDSYSSSVTYSVAKGKEVTTTVTTANTRTGYHRFIKAGTAHVFAIVGYDIATASYFVTTYTVMDDEVHDFEDYSYLSAAYNDNQTGVIKFEVPYEVEEYVLSRVGETEGLEVSSSGIVTGYNGTEKTVIIPEYHTIDNRDGTYKVVKIKGIASNAFNNKKITGITLSEFITAVPSNAFDGCTNLSIIDMDGVTTIGSEAFKDTKLDVIMLSDKITSLGQNVFLNYETVAINASNNNVINSVVNSGAKNIIVYISDKCKDLNEKDLKIPDNTNIFVFNGRGKTFNNTTIESDAKYTVINNAIFYSSNATPLKMSSSKVELGQIDISSTGISLILNASECNLALYGESAVSSTSDNAILCKNINVTKTEDANDKGVYSELDVNGDILLNGSINNQSMIKCNGQIKIINDDDYAKYLNGVYILIFDSNGGVTTESSKTIYYGKEIGTLPEATKIGHSFEGWFTEKNGGTKIEPSTISDFESDVTIYAHWKNNSYTASWKTGTGFSIKVERISSTNTSASLGSISSGDVVYYGDVLNVTYTKADYYTINSYGKTEIVVNGDVTEADIYATATLNKTSGWVLESAAPSDAQILNTKYKYTHRYYTTSSSSSLSGWTKYNTVRTSWGTRQGPVYSDPSNGSRNVTSESYVSSYKYKYSRYLSADGKTGGPVAGTWSGVSCKNYEEKTVDSKLTVTGTQTSTQYKNVYGGDGTFNIYQGNWFNETSIPQYSTRWYYQEPVYTYYYYQDKSEEGTSKPSGSDYSNVETWVQYREK